MLPVPTERKLVFVQKLVGSELIPVHGIMVGVGRIPPLVLAGNRLVLPPVPALDVQNLTSAVAGRTRGLVLAWIGDEHVLLPVLWY